VIRPGSSCRLLVGGDALIDGWMDTYAPSFDTEQHTVRVSGRSRTADLVDCSAIVPGGQFTGFDIAQIARALCKPFGVAVRVETSVGGAFADVQVQQGETVHELLDRLAAQRGLLLTDGPDGALVIARAGDRRASGALVAGENILSASATLSHAQRHSRYLVKAQAAGSDTWSGTAASEVQGEVADPAVTRYRPLLLVAEAQADGVSARDRACWECLSRAGRGTQASVTVQGWRQPDGRLWTPGEQVPVKAPWLGLDRLLLIVEACWLLDVGGTRCELMLMPPEAMTPEPGGKKQKKKGKDAKGDVWAGLTPVG
jgi:prophage tail gpP-like protein